MQPTLQLELSDTGRNSSYSLLIH